jgi:two-component system phosphate regulon sensor histidine kinase PhoR
MLFNSKVLALFLGCSIALLTFFFLNVVIGIPFRETYIPVLVSFFSSAVFIFLTLEFFVFKEIDEIYSLLERIKKKEYSIYFRKENWNTSNPLIKIKSEIADFAEKKQIEIEELKKLETFRREFLADVSHELKTPIFAAQGFVHTLIDGAINDLEVRDRFLGKAANSLEGLNILVKDLITISQLEIGEIKMQSQNFDIYKLTAGVFDQLDEEAKKRGTRLKFHKHSPRSCYVYADKNRLSQVLTNLIVNAIKYGNDKGNIIVSFVAENDFVFVSVKDDGPGIEQKHLHRIFERFYRIDRSRSRDQGGTGLGLAIVKHILEAHQSKIFVSSKPGKGTIFSFKIKKGKVINEKG